MNVRLGCSSREPRNRIKEKSVGDLRVVRFTEVEACAATEIDFTVTNARLYKRSIHRNSIAITVIKHEPATTNVTHSTSRNVEVVVAKNNPVLFSSFAGADHLKKIHLE